MSPKTLWNSAGRHSIRHIGMNRNSYWIWLSWQLFGNKTTNIYLAFVNILTENRQFRIIIHFIWGFSHCLAVSQIHDIFHQISFGAKMFSFSFNFPIYTVLFRIAIRGYRILSIYWTEIVFLLCKFYLNKFETLNEFINQIK